jgi:hypothetical protein
MVPWAQATLATEKHRPRGWDGENHVRINLYPDSTRGKGHVPELRTIGGIGPLLLRMRPATGHRATAPAQTRNRYVEQPAVTREADASHAALMASLHRR